MSEINDFTDDHFVTTLPAVMESIGRRKKVENVQDQMKILAFIYNAAESDELEETDQAQ